MDRSDTRPGSLDDAGRPHHRRMNEQRLDRIADSSLLKILQYIITGLLIPLLLWIGSAFLDRMSKIEGSVQKLTEVAGTNELRMTNLERSNSERDAAVKLLERQIIGLEYELRLVKAAK